MARRKQRFMFHGKCAYCAGPIADWREVEVLWRPRQIYLSKRNASMPAPEPEPSHMLVGFADAPRNYNTLPIPYQPDATHYCHTHRYLDAVDRLSPAPLRMVTSGVVNGRVDARRPNIQALPRFFEPQAGRPPYRCQ